MDAIDQAVQDVLQAASDTIARVLGTIATLLDLLKIIAPGNYQDQIPNFILQLIGIGKIAGDCGGQKRDCAGAITLVMAIVRVITKFADTIMLCKRTGTSLDNSNPSVLLETSSMQSSTCPKVYSGLRPDSFLWVSALSWMPSTSLSVPPSSGSRLFATFCNTSRRQSRRLSIVSSTKTRTWPRHSRPQKR